MNLRVESLRLSNLPEKKSATLRKPSSKRPSLYRDEEGDARAVIKDYSLSRRVHRNLIGRLFIWREKKTYRRLKGSGSVAGVRSHENLLGNSPAQSESV